MCVAGDDIVGLKKIWPFTYCFTCCLTWEMESRGCEEGERERGEDEEWLLIMWSQNLSHQIKSYNLFICLRGFTSYHTRSFQVLHTYKMELVKEHGNL